MRLERENAVLKEQMKVLQGIMADLLDGGTSPAAIALKRTVVEMEVGVSSSSGSASFGVSSSSGSASSSCEDTRNVRPRIVIKVESMVDNPDNGLVEVSPTPPPPPPPPPPPTPPWRIPPPPWRPMPSMAPRPQPAPTPSEAPRDPRRWYLC